MRSITAFMAADPLCGPDGGEDGSRLGAGPRRLDHLLTGLGHPPEDQRRQGDDEQDGAHEDEPRLRPSRPLPCASAPTRSLRAPELLDRAGGAGRDGERQSGHDDVARPVTWSHSESPGRTDTATDEPVTSDPGPCRIAWAEAIPAAGPPPKDRATRSPSDAASWATWVACIHRQNCTITRRTSMTTGTTMTASTTDEPSSDRTDPPWPARRLPSLRPMPADAAGVAGAPMAVAGPRPAGRISSG